MKLRIPNLLNLFAITLFLFSLKNSIQAQIKDTTKMNPQPKLITLNIDSSAYQSVFNGAPETVGFYSGLVTLKPEEKVGHHNTDEYEEILVIFSGEGKMIIEGEIKMDLKYGVIAYCPPHTEHDVINTGSLPLKYLYIASKTKY